MFKELKNKYAGEIVNEEEFDEINETGGLIIENNGNSGKEIGCTWWTAKEENTKDEFDFYTEPEE